MKDNFSKVTSIRIPLAALKLTKDLNISLADIFMKGLSAYTTLEAFDVRFYKDGQESLKVRYVLPEDLLSRLSGFEIELSNEDLKGKGNFEAFTMIENAFNSSKIALLSRSSILVSSLNPALLS